MKLQGGILKLGEQEKKEFKESSAVTGDIKIWIRSGSIKVDSSVG